MLRLAVAIVALLIACAGLALVVRGELLWGWQALAGGLIVLVGTVYERWRYRHLAERPDGSWEATGERFVDPSTGDPVEVFYDPRTGERRYVVDKQQPPAQRD
jgi:hypothetical protein